MPSEPQKLCLVRDGDPSNSAKYTHIPADRIEYVEIFPPVGIARFGDSEKEYFLAPEVPGHTNPPAGINRFRDNEQKIRRQAVRFRVYGYSRDNKILGEVNNQVTIGDNTERTYTLKWTVHVANKKAAHTAFQGRYAHPPITTIRNPHVQADLKPDDRTKLIVDAKGEIPTGTKFVNLKGTFQGSNSQVTEINSVYLGQLHVDDGDNDNDKTGRLIFVPGSGHAKCVADPTNSQPEIVSEFDSSDWIDTACDGWVKVEVNVPDSNGGLKVLKTSRHYATVISGPPKFAWGINAPTTLYNIIEDIYWHRSGQSQMQINYDFSKDIWPVLNSASLTSWTNNTALQGHGPSSNGHFSSEAVLAILKSDNVKKRNNLKARIFEKLRKPDFEDPTQADAKYMPRLSGDNGDMPDPGLFPADLQPDIKRFSALTKLQYERFRKWKDDDKALDSVWSPEPQQQRIEDFQKDDQPDYLTRASLESTIGDPLFPGIEMYWIAKLSTTYDFGVSDLVPPFRVNHGAPDSLTDPRFKPGDLTRGLSLPWQCDFMLCGTHWWPSTRPDDVVPRTIYENTMSQSGTPKQFTSAVKMRSAWTRGFRQTLDMGQTRTSTDIPWFASTDMVRYWNYLGIVRKHEKKFPIGSSQAHTVTAYVEGERLEL